MLTLCDMHNASAKECLLDLGGIVPDVDMKKSVIALGLLPLSSLVYAEQDVFELSIEQLAQIEVSVASLVQESILDAPASVSVVKREQWQANGARRVGDALEDVPSLVTLSSWGGSQVHNMRGYGSELSVRGIASSLNGVPLNSFAYSSSAYDKPNLQLALLDSIEIIRGPGSTLYGTDAFHGVMAYRLRHGESAGNQLQLNVADPQYEGASLYSASEWGRVDVDAGFAYQHQHDQHLGFTYTDPQSGLTERGERANQFENSSAFVQFGYQDTLGRWQLALYQDDYRAENFSGLGRQFYLPLPVKFQLQSPDMEEDLDHSDQISHFWMSSLNFERDMAGMTLSLKSYFWQSEQGWIFDNSRYPDSLTTRTNVTVPCKSDSSSTSLNPLICAHQLYQTVENERKGLSATLSGRDLGLARQWVLGAGMDLMGVTDGIYARRNSAGDYLERTAPGYLGEERRIHFIFMQARSRLSDNGELNYGVRYDEYDDVGGHTSPRLAYLYSLSNVARLKFLYGHAFRAPSAIELYGSGSALGNSELKPEIINSYEAVYQYASQAVQFDATLYYNQWRDGITLVPVGDGINNQYQNTDENRAHGVELSLQTRQGLYAWHAMGSYGRSENTQQHYTYRASPAWILQLGLQRELPAYHLQLGINQRVLLDYDQQDYLTGTESQAAANYWRTDIFMQQKLSRAQQLRVQVKNLFARQNELPALYNAPDALLEAGRSVQLDWQLDF